MAEIIAYEVKVDDAHTHGDTINIRVTEEGLALTISGLPFIQEVESGDQNGAPEQKIVTNQEVPYIVNKLTIEFKNGQVVVSEG